MTSILRLVTNKLVLNSFKNSLVLNRALIPGTFLCDKEQFFKFSTESRVSINYDEIKNKINELIAKPESIKYEDIKKFMYVTKSDEDCDLLINASNIAKKQKANIKSILLELLVSLNKTDKSLKLFNESYMEKDALDYNSLNTLFKKLKYEKRYDEIFNLYDKLLTTTNSQADAYLNNLFLKVSQSLLILNTDESYEKMKDYIARLDKLGKNKFNLQTVINIVLLSVNKNDPEYALKYLEKLTNKNSIVKNLESILYSKTNRLEESLKSIESLLENKEKSIFKKILPLTLESLKAAIEKSESKALLEKYNELENRIKNENELSKIDLYESTTQQIFKNNKFEKESYNFYSPFRNETRKNSSNESENLKDSNNKNNKKNVKQKTQKMDAESKEAQKKPTNNGSIVFSNDELLNEMNDLFKKNKIKELVDSFEIRILNKFNNGEEFRSIHVPLVSLYTNSLLNLNNRNSWNKMKNLVNLFNQNNFDLSDDSKLHVYLLAILQNEPHFAFGFIALSGVDKLSQSIYANLKAIALIKLDNTKKAFEEIKTVTDMNLNKFSNEGCIFPFTLKAAEEKLPQLDSMQKKMFLSLKNKIIEENRLLNVDLFEFCSKSIHGSNFIENLDKKSKKVDSKNEDNIIKVSKNESNGTQEESQQHEKEREQKIINIRGPMKLKRSDNYGNIKSLLDIEKIKNELASKNYAEIIREFENFFIKYPNVRLRTGHLNFLTHALYKNRATWSQIENVLNCLKKTKSILSHYSLVELFLSIIYNKEYLYAMELLYKFDETNSLKRENIVLYNNLLACGFSLINKPDLALTLIENTINDTNVKTYPRVYPFTLKCLEIGVENSLSDDLSKKYVEVKNNISKANKLFFRDLDDLTKGPEDFDEVTTKNAQNN